MMLINIKYYKPNIILNIKKSNIKTRRLCKGDKKGEENMNEPKTETLETVGKRLKEWRLDNDLTQAELADKFGFQSNYISQVEKGTAGLSQDTLMQMPKLLNLNTNWLLTGKGSMDLQPTSKTT